MFNNLQVIGGFAKGSVAGCREQARTHEAGQSGSPVPTYPSLGQRSFLFVPPIPHGIPRLQEV